MIKPTIGRVVLVHGSNVQNNGPEQPCAALVAFVWSDRLINVGGVNHSGIAFAATSVPLLQDDDVAPTDGSTYAEWMPYQKGQAAKYDELAAKVGGST